MKPLLMTLTHFKTFILLLGYLSNGLSSNSLQAQVAQSPLVFDTKLTYEVRFLGDSTDSQSVRTELTHLLINDATSLFESSQAATMDSIKYLVQDETEKKRLRAASSQGTTIPYKIFKKANRITTYDILFNNPENTSGIGFYYDEPLPEWELSTDTATIHGVLCQKATTQLGNRGWIAWFTTEIPISDGPYKFGGLPGLVVQVQDKQDHWVCTLRDIANALNYASTLQGQMDFEPLRSKQAFLEAKREYTESIFEKEELRTGRKYTPETRAIIEKRLQSMMKLSSNWIELDSSK